MPSVSVIIPLYNAGKDILPCLGSLTRQTLQDFELLLIDDGSTDHSPILAEKFLREHPDLKNKTRFIHQQNRGVAVTRNRGIEEAAGTFIAFVDQDDRIARDYLETYYKAMEDQDIVVGGFLRVSRRGRILKKKTVTEKPWSKYTMIVPWGHLYRRQFLLDSNIRFLDNRIGEDIPFSLAAYRSTKKIRVIPYTGYRWMYNESSVSNSVHKTLDSHLDIRYLLDSLYSAIEPLGANEDAMIRYFYLRFITWYFLYSTRGSRKKNIQEAYRTAFDWLKTHFPDYRKEKYIGLRMPRGESFSLHAAVFGFYLLEKLHLLLPVLKLFGRS